MQAGQLFFLKLRERQNILIPFSLSLSPLQGLPGRLGQGSLPWPCTAVHTASWNLDGKSESQPCPCLLAALSTLLSLSQFLACRGGGTSNSHTERVLRIGTIMHVDGLAGRRACSKPLYYLCYYFVAGESNQSQFSKNAGKYILILKVMRLLNKQSVKPNVTGSKRRSKNVCGQFHVLPTASFPP